MKQLRNYILILKECINELANASQIGSTTLNKYNTLKRAGDIFTLMKKSISLNTVLRTTKSYFKNCKYHMCY